MPAAHNQGERRAGEGEVAGGGQRELREMEERKARQARRVQSYFNITLLQGREMTVESLLIATGHKANLFPSLLSTRPR